MALLTAPFESSIPRGWTSDAVQVASQLQRAHEEAAQRIQQQAQEAQRIEEARQRAQQAVLDGAMQDLRRTAEKKAYDEKVDRDYSLANRRVNIQEAANAPFKAPVASPSSAAVGALSGATVTDYGQANDATPDNLTRAGKSAIGQLRSDSLAVSPDIEAKLNSQGIKIGSPVVVTLDDGSKVTRFWDDRTAEQFGGKKLTGRVDLYSPDGPSPLRGHGVLGIEPASPSQQAVSAVDPGQELAMNLQRRGTPTHLAQTQLAEFERQNALAKARQSVGSAGQTLEEITAGMQPVPEHNTYRRPDGSEYFVEQTATGKVALRPFRPKENVAKKWFLGTDGNAYAGGSDGTLMQPKPDDVQLLDGKIHDRALSDGSVIIVHPDATYTTVIPAGVKLGEAGKKDYLQAVESAQSALIDLTAVKKAYDAKIPGTHWFGVTQKTVDEAQKTYEEAQSKVSELQKLYPQLSSAAAQGGLTPSGAQPTASAAAERVATNPQTGEKVVLRNGQWVPLTP